MRPGDCPCGEGRCLSLIELKNVTYIYGKGAPYEKKALDEVSLTVNDSEITGIIGHTGSGKSTLVQLLNGLLKPDSGQILLDGKDIWEDAKKNRAGTLQGRSCDAVSGISAF